MHLTVRETVSSHTEDESLVWISDMLLELCKGGAGVYIVLMGGDKVYQVFFDQVRMTWTGESGWHYGCIDGIDVVYMLVTHLSCLCVLTLFHNATCRSAMDHPKRLFFSPHQRGKV